METLETEVVVSQMYLTSEATLETLRKVVSAPFETADRRSCWVVQAAEAKLDGKFSCT